MATSTRLNERPTPPPKSDRGPVRYDDPRPSGMERVREDVEPFRAADIIEVRESRWMCSAADRAQLEQAHSIGDFSQAIAGEHVALTRGSEESPSNVGAAGSEEVLVWIRADAQRETGFWIWAAADNLRVLALNAIEAAQQMASAMPKGKLQ